MKTTVTAFMLNPREITGGNFQRSLDRGVYMAAKELSKQSNLIPPFKSEYLKNLAKVEHSGLNATVNWGSYRPSLEHYRNYTNPPTQFWAYKSAEDEGRRRKIDEAFEMELPK